MHLQWFQGGKFQDFYGCFPLDPLGFAQPSRGPQNILPSYGAVSHSVVDNTSQLTNYLYLIFCTSSEA